MSQVFLALGCSLRLCGFGLWRHTLPSTREYGLLVSLAVNLTCRQAEDNSSSNTNTTDCLTLPKARCIGLQARAVSVMWWSCWASHHCKLYNCHSAHSRKSCGRHPEKNSFGELKTLVYGKMSNVLLWEGPPVNFCQFGMTRLHEITNSNFLYSSSSR